MATSPPIARGADPIGRPAPDSPSHGGHRPVRVIEPRRPGLTTSAREGWRSRRMRPFFAARMLEKLYARTWLGILWLPLRPGLDLVLKVGVIGSLIGANAPGDVPYLLYAIIGMAFWEFFEKLAFWGTRSLETNRSLLRKVYLPRLPMLFGAFTPAALFFGMYAIATVASVVYFLVVDGTTYLQIGPETLIALAGIAMLAAYGLLIGLFLSPIGLYVRDVRFTLGYVTGFWFYVTPILWTAEKAPGVLDVAVVANPVSAPILLIKHGLLGTPLPPVASVVASLATFAVLLPLALIFYGRAEATAAAGA